MIMQLFGLIVTLVTFGLVDVVDTDYSNDVYYPVVELGDLSLYDVFSVVDPYDWEDVNSTFSLSLTESQLDDLHDTYLTIKDYAPYQRSTSTLNDTSYADLVIALSFIMIWVFALPYGIKYIKKTS